MQAEKFFGGVSIKRSFAVKLSKASSHGGMAYIGPDCQSSGFKAEKLSRAFMFEKPAEAVIFADHCKGWFRGFHGSVDISVVMHNQALSGLALNWAVAKALGHEVTIANKDESHQKIILVDDGDTVDLVFEPSKNPTQGDQLITKFGLIVEPFKGDTDDWRCFEFTEGHASQGETKYIAAMRCILLMKIGEEIQVTDELLAILMAGG